jgi:hypothetical protein
LNPYGLWRITHLTYSKLSPWIDVYSRPVWGFNSRNWLRLWFVDVHRRDSSKGTFVREAF